MKKFLSVILSLIIASSVVPLAFAAEDETNIIEISFKIGESDILINGQSFEVETPYVTDGAVLVPLRVITEAFGAEVLWDDDEQKITLEHPEVTITLYIGESEALVNTHTETLPVPPVLSDLGVTMIPLRFVAETFGALVQYDHESGTVSVTKEGPLENSTIGSVSDKPRIGDSDLHWSMNTPSNLFMSDRTSDGLYTEFSDDDYSELSIEITQIDEDYSFEAAFIDMKDYVSGLTLTRADKGEDEFGNKTMHVSARSKYVNVDCRAVVSDKYVYEIYIVSDAESDILDTLCAIADTFTPSFGDREITHDLYVEKEGGYGEFSDEDFKISFKLPRRLEYLEYGNMMLNKFYFYSEGDEELALNVSVYSMSDTVSAPLLAQKEQSVAKSYFDPGFASLSDVSPYEADDLDNAFFFTAKMKDGDDTYELCSVYFEKGDYLYVFYLISENDANEVMKEIISSVNVEELDFSTVGPLLADEYDFDGTYTVKGEGWSMSVPVIWRKSYSYDTYASYYHRITDASLRFSMANGKRMSLPDMYSYATDLYRDSYASSFTELTESVHAKTYGNNTFYTFSGKTEDYYGDSECVTVAITFSGGKIYQFVYRRSPEYDSALATEEFESILASFKA